MKKIAIPLANRCLCMHFGHCEEFAVVEADETTGIIRKIEYLTPPPHEPGLLPRWIGAQGVGIVIAGGMGERALELLKAQDIEVVTGANAADPEALISAYLAGTLVRGVNVCSHEANQHQHCHGAGHN